MADDVEVYKLTGGVSSKRTKAHKEEGVKEQWKLSVRAFGWSLPVNSILHSDQVLL